MLQEPHLPGGILTSQVLAQRPPPPSALRLTASPASQELLSLCGGDLSSALPWLELHTLNFSYNAIACLDQSIVSLTNASVAVVLRR